MMKKIPLLFLLFFLSFSFAIGQGTWTQKANFPGPPRCGAYAFSIGHKGYFGMGFSYPNNMNNDFWEWDQLTNVWTQKASLPGLPRRNGMSFSIGTKGYICIGIDSSNFSTHEVWEWDQNSNTWTQKADFPGTYFDLGVSFSIGPKGYIVAGESLNNQFWEYDPILDTWSQKANFPGIPRYNAQGFSLGLKGYVGGGATDMGPPFYFMDFWEYDQVSDTWVQKANLPENRCNGAGFSICNRGYFCAGVADHGELNDLIEWNPSSNMWTQKSSLPSNIRSQPSGFAIANKGYIGLGVSGSILLNDFWEYTPDTLCIDTLTPSVDTTTNSSINNVIYISNIFSPNNDGTNDVFRLKGNNISQVDSKVYDRWGNLVFVTQDINETWSGRYKNNDCPEGVYYYMANITFTNGETTMKKGNITLVR